MSKEDEVSSAIFDLYDAIDLEDVETVKLILKSSSLNLNQSPAPRELTVLHLAVGLGSVEIVKLLLDYGADPNCTACSDGVSPVHLSVLYDDKDILKILIKAGGDPHALDTKENKNCFDYLQEKEDKGSDLASLLAELTLAKGAEPSTSSHVEETTSYESYYSCSSSNSVKDETVAPVDNQSERTPVKEESAQRNLFCTTVNTEGISDENHYTFVTNDSFSIYLPRPVQKCKAEKIPELSVVESGSSTFSETRTNYSSESVIPSRSPTEEELVTIKAVATSRGFPVLPSTVKVLSKHIDTRKRDIELSPPKHSSRYGYSVELDYLIRNIDVSNVWQEHQVEFVQNFQPGKNASKSFYNYLLLDPYVVKRTNFSGNHLRTGLLINNEKLQIFINAVFYIGKGSGTRPLQHLVDAKARLTTKLKHRLPDSEKLGKVVSIWERGQGVIVVSIFHHSQELESKAYEAAMIDAMSLSCTHFTNLKKGSYEKTPAHAWSQKKKNQFGSVLLYKAYCAFVVGSYKSFYPRDV